MKKKSRKDMQKLMKISADLANLNKLRYEAFDFSFDKSLTKQAIYAFTGEVYHSFAANSLAVDDILFAQDKIRILSGLYGLIRPLDRIQAYRLEMDVKLKVGRHKNLYQFWNERVYSLLLEDMEKENCQTVINLASEEYAKTVQTYLINNEQINFISIKFLEKKDAKYKIMAFHAKKARGLLARFIIKNRISKEEDIKTFNHEGYQFDTSASNAKQWIFKRG